MSCSTHQIIDLADSITYAEQLGAGAWIIFDIDHVLTQPSESSFQLATIKRYWHHTLRYMIGLSPEQQDLVYSLLVSESSSELVQEQASSIISTLQERGFTVIGLTAALSGPVSKIPDFCHWRYEELKRLGIDLTISSPAIDNYQLKQFPDFNGQHPAWYNGVLFTNGQNSKASKGEVLQAFCTEHGLSFPSLLFVDDTLSNIKKLEKTLLQWRPTIRAHLLHFKGHTPAGNNFDVQRMRRLWRELVKKAKDPDTQGASPKQAKFKQDKPKAKKVNSMKLLLKDIFNYYRIAYRFRSYFWQGMVAMLSSTVKKKGTIAVLTLLMPLILIRTAFQASARQYGRLTAWRRWVVVMTYWPLEFYLRRVKYGLDGPYSKGPFVPKLHWNTFFEKLQIMTPPVVAVVRDGQLTGQLPKETLFIKPDEGALGQKTHQFSWNAGQENFQSATDASSYSEEQFKAWLSRLSTEEDQKAYVIQPVVQICQELKHLSSHTLRLVTFKKYDGSIVLVNPCFHLSNGHITSHAANGGAYFEVDVERGLIGKRFLGTEMKENVEGLVLPYIYEAIKQAVHAHQNLPDGILWAGWDVMMTDQGPCFLEGNIPPGDLYHFLFYPKLRKMWDEVCWPELLTYLAKSRRGDSREV